MFRDVENLRFNALRNALYHTARRRFFELWNRIFNFAVVMLGAAAVGDLLSKYGIDQVPVGVAVAAVGAAQLVFDFGRSARDHQSLQRDYYNLLADIEQTVDPSDDKCAEWQAKMIRFAADEPPTYRAVDAKAYNDAAGALELDKGQFLRIPWWHLLLQWVWTFNGHGYKKSFQGMRQQ
ncbi:hypothetical protein HNQ95_002960 [Aminobacter ciceronei]|nr:hypothetical protein [Aminobacter ciceronei]MBA8907178.1 hypothetical protein [Aminobacter ciceronei]